MKVLITGGAGYIGTELVGRLITNDAVQEIIIYDNLERGSYSFFLAGKLHEHNNIRFVQGDILDSRKLKMVLKGVDVVYHLAARVTTPFANTDAHNFEQVNHWGTAETVYAVEDSDVKQFIFLSSTSVYGPTDEPINENHKPNPKTLYGISKFRAEEHVNRLAGKKSVHIIRCGNVYGYNRSLRFDAVINRFAFEAHFNRRISIHGNGKQTRAFIHIELACEVLEELLTGKVPTGTYNLTDKNLSILDLVDVFKEIYPDLEFIFINQHLQLRQMLISPPEKLRQYISFRDSRTLKNELEEFKMKFSF